MDILRPLSAVAVVAIIVGAIVYIESQKSEQATTPAIELGADMSAAEKASQYPAAKEIAQPAGFINTEPFTLGDLIGQQVILVDFWTYSCINCQRTLPYLNDWQKKYGDKGLTIVGVHTPEFEFEQELVNVQQAVNKFGVTYPVVLDNEYATWRAYDNRYWPRKYLVDIDGFIVYDHIGEGAYQETEAKIQELLAERAQRLGVEAPGAQSLSTLAEAPTRSDDSRLSPEVYFGAARNKLLSNGRAGTAGRQELAAQDQAGLNELQLVGSWDINDEFASAVAADDAIVFRYRAKDVYIVAASEQPVDVQVLVDGRPVATPGADVEDGRVTISEEQLYHLVADNAVSERTLELRIPKPGLRAFTFTFG
jgi:thiol-disulfide isomerase/thioredoxin